MANRKVKQAKQQVQFALRRGVSIGGVKADDIGAALTQIYEKQGTLTTKGLVDESRPEHAVLHPAFEWDDSKAGELYRETQARHIIKCVEVVKTDVVGEETRTPAFVHIQSQTPGERDGTYEPISVVVQHPDKFVLALSAAHQRMDAAKNAVEDLRNAASESNQPEDRMAALTIAAMALQTAKDAVQRLQ
jgi:hypothetical protein